MLQLGIVGIGGGQPRPEVEGGLVGREGALDLTLRPLDVAELAPADREATLPLDVRGCGGGQLLLDRQGAIRRRLGPFRVSQHQEEVDGQQVGGNDRHGVAGRCRRRSGGSAGIEGGLRVARFLFELGQRQPRLSILGSGLHGVPERFEPALAIETRSDPGGWGRFGHVARRPAE